MTAELFIMELTAHLQQEIMGPNGDQFLAGLSVLGALITGMLAVVLAGFLIRLIARYRIFQKAGEKGYKSLIPFYGNYVQYGLTWKSNMYLLMLALSVIGSVITGNYAEGFLSFLGSLFVLVSGILSLIQLHKLSRSFGHGFGFTLGLFFLEPIFLLILAFGKSRYEGPVL